MNSEKDGRGQQTNPYKTQKESPTLTMDLIKREFDLTTNESVYDDFGCTLKTPGLFHTGVLNSIMQGRIYLTDHYICFNNSMVGNKVKLHLRDVVSITKNKVMSVFDNGILVT